MANRICPICFGKVPRAGILSRSNEVLCPHCGRALELSRPSRVLASLAGLAGACLAFHFTRGSGEGLNWVLPGVAAILAFGIAAPLFLALSSDLVFIMDAPAEALAAEPSHGHPSH